MDAFQDVTGADLTVGATVYLDGARRAVLAVAPSGVPGYRYVHFEGFTTPFHIADHWPYSRVS